MHQSTNSGLALARPLDRRAIGELVESFYTAVRADPLLAPVFEASIDGHWPQHLERMTDFWCTVMLGSRSFRGNVMERHLALSGIGDAHFERWLALWQQHTERGFEPEAAARLQVVAHGIARMIQLARSRAATAG